MRETDCSCIGREALSHPRHALNGGTLPNGTRVGDSLRRVGRNACVSGNGTHVSGNGIQASGSPDTIPELPRRRCPVGVARSFLDPRVLALLVVAALVLGTLNSAWLWFRRAETQSLDKPSDSVCRDYCEAVWEGVDLTALKAPRRHSPPRTIESIRRQYGGAHHLTDEQIAHAFWQRYLPHLDRDEVVADMLAPPPGDPSTQRAAYVVAGGSPSQCLASCRLCGKAVCRAN